MVSPATAQDTAAAPSDQPTDSQPIPPTGAEATDNVSHNVVVLRALDKITARITELDVPIGKEVRFGTLALTAKYCRTRPPIEPPETYAYLQIDDIKRAGKRERIFDGWMVASSPALNPLEHPVYDVWVMSCKTVSPEATSGSE
ncbi:DUF2155 domain-containing protein [Kordiimonas marina]|uniref:DUF2155 domain-containing protein n=1 Tax=Kordiimonas marina TaxID=2872312 RepID=UPI001FF44E23|nr:DUF2155 domain-containing protein [Kordiimonas marina]MCJ9428978.1 DUF2155 domain-containing protein [Kordiimonas marina]